MSVWVCGCACERVCVCKQRECVMGRMSEKEKEQRREMRKVNLTVHWICGHTPTPKQTSVSKSHKSPASLLLYEAITHTHSLLTSLADTSAPCLMSMFTHSTDPSLAALWRGVWGKEENVQNKKNERILSPIPFSLSLSLLSITFPFSLSLSSLSSLFWFGPLSQYTRRSSMKEALTNWKSLSDITCIHDETHRKW